MLHATERGEITQVAIPQEIVTEPLGSDFSVVRAADRLGIDAAGWIVTYRPTGRFLWTAGSMTLGEARQTLLKDALSQP